MPTQAWQVILLIALVTAEAAGQSAEARGRWARQLSAECDALIELAVRRPYGWGWDELPTYSQKPEAPRAVAMTPLATPGAGLLLLEAGELLDEPRFIEAARQAARGVVASQLASGVVRTRATFGPTAGGRDEPTYIPDRAPTRAGLALLLSVIESDPQSRPNAPLRAAAVRCTTWLTRQQANNGMWVMGYPPEAAPAEALRIARLDDGEFRDSTIALLLSADVLSDPAVSISARKSLDMLLKLRFGKLWSAAYAPDGANVDPALGFPDGDDVLASGCAMQALLAGYILTGQRSWALALDESARALQAARGEDGLWDRFLNPSPLPPTTAPADERPSTEPTAVRAKRVASSAIPSPWPRGDFGVGRLLVAVEQIRGIGRERYVAMFAPSR
ncbi:MAG: hypothetical protein ACREJC_14890, partial [Tepidisphaeraceae bacterium]